LCTVAAIATIASIAGCTECIEPQISNLFRRETLSGDFLQVNRHLVAELKAQGLWNEATRNRLKLAEGSVQGEAELPELLRAIYRTAWEIPMRSLIDMAADRGAFQTKVESQNYPPDLETLVNGVDVQGKKLKFLRKIPIDPMTHQTDWGMRSMQDDPDSDSFGGQSVFDVYSKSQGTGLDGTKYSTW